MNFLFYSSFISSMKFFHVWNFSNYSRKSVLISRNGTNSCDTVINWKNNWPWSVEPWWLHNDWLIDIVKGQFHSRVVSIGRPPEGIPSWSASIDCPFKFRANWPGIFAAFPAFNSMNVQQQFSSFHHAIILFKVM